MNLSKHKKDEIKHQIIECLKSEPEIKKIIIFGSFVNSDTPNDIDIAVFQETYSASRDFITLGAKYLKDLHSILTEVMPIDVIPISPNARKESPFMLEILKGEVIYER